jgi:hypothetical protein
MIKHFCDYCGEEILEEHLNNNFKVERNTYTNGDLSATIMAKNIQINLQEGRVFEICKYCLIDLVNSLDDRTKAG